MMSLIRELFLKDLWLKLFSLGLATLIYFTISFAIKNDLSPLSASFGMASEAHTFFTVPVTVISTASDVRQFRVEPEQVAVTVQGDVKSLANLQSSGIRALVDLTGIEAGADVHRRIEVSTPAGVTHVRVRPAEVRIIFPSK